MSEKTATDGQRGVGACLQILQEVLAVEVPELLHIPENDAAFPSQVLRQIQALHLGEIVFDDVAERADVLPLCGNHLVHDVLHFTGEKEDTKRCKTEYFLQCIDIFIDIIPTNNNFSKVFSLFLIHFTKFIKHI